MPSPDCASLHPGYFFLRGRTRIGWRGIGWGGHNGVRRDCCHGAAAARIYATGLRPKGGHGVHPIEPGVPPGMLPHRSGV